MDLESTRRQALLVREQSQRVRYRSRALQARLARDSRAQAARLSAREVQVLRLVSSGITTKEVARRLEISINTANYHLANVYRKLGAHSRVAAANAFHRMFARDQQD